MVEQIINSCSVCEIELKDAFTCKECGTNVHNGCYRPPYKECNECARSLDGLARLSS